jgi:hypothetical protein
MRRLRTRRTAGPAAICETCAQVCDQACAAAARQDQTRTTALAASLGRAI